MNGFAAHNHSERNYQDKENVLLFPAQVKRRLANGSAAGHQSAPPAGEPATR